jgi:hypothetical protein
MTGFKQGASSDPYGSDESDNSDELDAAATDNTDVDSQTDDTEQRSSEVSATTSSGQQNASEGGQPSDTGLPWIYRRSGITDGRHKTVQLHLQRETVNEEDEFQTALTRELGEKPKKADIREAAFLIGMQQLDDVANLLREWGYDRS